ELVFGARDAAGRVGADHLARRGLLVLTQPFEGLPVELQLHASFRDPPDRLGRYVAWAREQAGDDRQSVEDVVPAVADDLVDGAETLARGVDDGPAGLDQQPGDRVAGGAHTVRPATCQTGPCVPTGCV